MKLCRSYLWLVCTVFLHHTFADVYLHTPRGSNNRLDGENANRQNNNRVFDSQNNAKGGYNVAEKNEQKSTDWFHMNYYMSGSGEGNETILPIEWTNQHGCRHRDVNCNFVLQYKCQPTSITEQHRAMRNGRTRQTPQYGKQNFNTYSEKENRVKSDAGQDRVLNEPWEWYDKCNTRKRNKGLFTADQDLKGETSKYTRQNPNGGQSGYECPEERDYYPYWHPTDWIDIAVLAERASHCEKYYKESFNTNSKGECIERYKNGDRNRHASEHNNKAACEGNGGKWVNFDNYLEIVPDKTEAECQSMGEKYFWGTPYRSEDIDQLEGEDPEQWKKCLVRLPKPVCRVAPRSRTNHLGNVRGIRPAVFYWKLPHFPSGQEQRCVLRIRYNISTDDYNPHQTFSSSNNDDDVISNDPDVNVGQEGDNKVTLQLAINTAQFGRVFQDRSHIFKLIPRKDHFESGRIINLNVRGKRGNIVQVYPAVEYDFTFKSLVIRSTDYVHMQFAGSNKNPSGNDGEGRRQTDRNNFVAMRRPGLSYPLEDTADTLFDRATVIDAPDPDDLANTETGADIVTAMATAGRFKRAQDVPNPFQFGNCNAQQAQQLDCVPPSWTGLLLRLSPGRYYYMCTRNNNFSNRNQKASIRVRT
ncbi:protein DD3-3-like [Dendronephthya gigantea]|uniref:protein DD3-3-like n=1 Tax=Dendronephthya gigantea TaxID=151771 RepID=UPI0010692C7F|nr:protein DD3-3-like [Dendronephthya gigantea]